MGMLRTLAPGQTGFKLFQGTAAALFKAPDYPLEEYFPAEFALQQLGEHVLRNPRWEGILGNFRHCSLLNITSSGCRKRMFLVGFHLERCYRLAK